MAQRLLCHLFTRGLPKDMRKHIHLMRPESLNSALVLAITVDQVSDNERPSKPNNYTASVAQGRKKSPKSKKGKRNSFQTSDTVAAAVTANDSQIIQTVNKLGE